jgi:dephospho-CoA kinase
MLQLGLTGGIGAGKSAVSNVFSKLGCPVYQSDYRAKWLMMNNKDLNEGIISLFGSDAFKNNQLNRSFISSIVFDDNKKLEKLNHLVHPFVAVDYQEFVSKNSSAELIVKEAAVLIESGAYKQMDLILLIVSDFENRIKWVVNRDQSNFDEVQKRMSHQLNDFEKKKYANFVLTNNASIEDLENKVVKLYKEIKLSIKKQ